ncbi:pyridoxal 5'-phosphate synthase pdxS subunit, partial [Phenoliferia sp. Uapishka_3]
MTNATNGTNGNGAAAAPLPLYHHSLGNGTFALKVRLHRIPPSSTLRKTPWPKADSRFPDFSTQSGLAQMLKGGVIMDVINVEEAIIAERAGAVAVMALERVPSDIRKDGGVARMSDPKMIKEIMAAVSIPVMAKARIGHQVEVQILQVLGVDYIDESEVLSLADPTLHVDKHSFNVPFVCGCKDLGEALRRINEGAALIRTKGEAGTGNIIEAVRHARKVGEQIRLAQGMTDAQLYCYAKELSAPFELLKETAQLGRLPVVMFSAGGIATPADAALMMQLGCDGVFVGSGIFKSHNPEALARAMVIATTNYNNPQAIADCMTGLGPGMTGIDYPTLKMADRGSN